MTDKERFGAEWAREVERRFQQQVLADTFGAWTKSRIEKTAQENCLSVRWENEILCFLSSPDAMGGHVALRLGQPVTPEDEAAINWLKKWAAINHSVSR